MVDQIDKTYGLGGSTFSSKQEVTCGCHMAMGAAILNFTQLFNAIVNITQLVNDQIDYA